MYVLNISFLKSSQSSDELPERQVSIERLYFYLVDNIFHRNEKNKREKTGLYQNMGSLGCSTDI